MKTGCPKCCSCHAENASANSLLIACELGVMMTSRSLPRAACDEIAPRPIANRNAIGVTSSSANRAMRTVRRDMAAVQSQVGGILRGGGHHFEGVLRRRL